MADELEGRPSALAIAAAHWSAPPPHVARTRWWESPLIVQHINHGICGKRVPGTAGGDIELLRQINGGRPLERAVSVGCGLAQHEIWLLQAGVVKHFDLFEISPSRVHQALQRAQSAGVVDRINIQLADAFEAPATPRYDLVYWKDALHHMFDVTAAMRWSRDVLVEGGTFFMNEFVGPTQMQYTDRQLDLAERVRASLPDRCLVNPHRRDAQVALRRVRPDPAALAAVDPSECADSSNILPALGAVFPNAIVKLAGGVVYMLALNDILANFDEVEDRNLLQAMMLADDLCVEAGESLYAVGYAHKPVG